MHLAWAQCIRSRTASWLCLAVVLLAAVLPLHGLGWPLCTFRRLTQQPCLACGLTRSFSHMARLDIAGAAMYHPLGLALFPLACAGALLLVLRPGVRAGAADWIEARPGVANAISFLLGATFLLYGIGRVVWLYWRGIPSPW